MVIKGYRSLRMDQQLGKMFHNGHVSEEKVFPCASRFLLSLFSKASIFQYRVVTNTDFTNSVIPRNS